MSTRKLSDEIEDAEDIKSWDLPYVEQPNIDETKTNALNRSSTWRYEPPEPEPEILPPTAEEIEAIRQAAYEEGFTEGKKAGFEEGKTEGFEQGLQEGHTEGLQKGIEQGLEEGRERINEQSQYWQKLNDSLYQPVEQVTNDVHAELVRLAVVIAQRVINVEVKTNQNVVIEALKSAVHTLPIKESQVHIRLNPDDILLVKSAFDDAHIESNNWHLIAAPEMQRGGCEVSTENNAVDFSIERRSKDVIDTFLMQQGLNDG